MARLYVGGLDPATTERDLEDEFTRFGTLRTVWVARKPPGFAFIEYDDERDAEDATRKLDGLHGWRVEASRRGERRPPPGGRDGRDGRGGPPGYRGGGGGMRSEMKCYECGEIGHFAKDCRARGGGGGGGGGGGYDRGDRGGGYDRGGSDRDRDRGYGGGGGGGSRYDRPRSRSPARSPARARSLSPRRSPSYPNSPR